VEEAAKAVGAHEIAERLPRGYDTLLGKWFAHGTQLSAGEWQRVALARTFIRSAPIVVLDEPTSFMDSWSEAKWLDRLRAAIEGRTTLIVTHRFTVALRADVVFVMQGGKVVESGAPQALLARGGLFAESWQSQQRAAAAPAAADPAPGRR
jgi:ATP-binding cassette subfamily B protein